MNNTRRRAIRKVMKELKSNAPNWDFIQSELSALLDEEQDALDNIPESLQDTDRYAIGEESVDYLEAAVAAAEVDPDDDPEVIQDAVEEILDALNSIDGI